MPIKDILVVVENVKGIEGRLEIAARLAREHDAHLIGLFVRTVPHVPPFILSQLGPEVVNMQRQWADEAADKAKLLFDAHVSGLRTEWRAVSGELIDQCTLHAKYVDLVVAGQNEPGQETVEGQAELIDHLVLDAGRPVLVVPYAFRLSSFGERALVAWNATREATRAVNDALPLLRRAKVVSVVAINPRGGHGRDGHGQMPAADICLHLARQGVKAEAEHIESHDLDIGATLLSRAADTAVDLIVMGAYGRSRLRELVLGGATRHILRHMTAPVLMSH